MPSVVADGRYYVDHGGDPFFTPGSFVSIYPENLTFDDQIRGVGNIAYDISQFATDQDGNAVITGNDFLPPFGRYYRLRWGDIAIMAGVITSTNRRKGDSFLKVAGKTWEHFFERWQYPFDPRGDVKNAGDPVNAYRYPSTFQGNEISGSGIDTPTGLAYQASNRDVILIWYDILYPTLSIGNRIPFDITALINPCGITTNYQFSLGDDSYMDTVVNDLSGTGNGFDWWIGHDLIVHWASPYRYGNNSSPTYVWFLDNTSPDPNVLEFTNNGPAATHVFGQGAGLATSTKLGRAYGYGPAQVQFTRLDKSYDFGDVRNVNQIILKTQKQLSLDLQPQHEIPLSIDPSRFANFWTTFRKGRAIFIDQTLIDHRIDSGQQLVGYSATVDNAGNAMVDFTLRQIYDLSINAGTPEG